MNSTLTPASIQASPDEVVWYGLDYSLVKFIGLSQDFNDIDRIQSYFFRNWNELILAEAKKYDLYSAFGVRRIDYNMDKAIERSESRSMDGILQLEPYSIPEARLVELIQVYKDPAVQKTGALFVMETLNKKEQKATMWVVFFDIPTGNTLSVRHYITSPAGFGFRNYWARPYYNVIRSLAKSSRKPI